PLYLLSFVPFLFTIPFFAGISIDATANEALGIALVLATLAFFFLFFFAVVLSAPFFQSLKAVLYYDLRNRREGLDLQFRDRPSDPDRP
ncbi:MAG: DUF975 domain-containing protein, partial [Cyanobacteria bacterium J06607_6]